MNPLNNSKETCSPISSNCVIWQGPDIECINLCKGATVSDAVAALATELCAIMEYTKIDNYDLKCLTPAVCPPKDFSVLIQLIIDKLCSITPGTPSPVREPGCPDCEVIVAPCFRFTNEFGDLVTSMNLTDYAIAIGNKVCDLVSQINTINQTLANHETRITNLENEPDPTFTLPLVTPVCVLPSEPTDMNIVLAALEAQFCELIGATGQSSDIYTALTRQCAGLNTEPQLTGGGPMSSIPNWVNNVQNLAGAINNLWLTICDIRSAISTIQANCCPSGCDGIVLNMTAQLEGTTLKMYITGTVPPEFATCAPGTTTFTITDGTNSVTYPLNILTILNNPSGYSFDLSVTPLNLALNLTISANPCLYNVTTESTCQFALSYVSAYPGTCPVLTYTQTESSIAYTGIVSSVATYIVEVWNNAGTILIATQSSNLNPGNTLSGTFLGLAASTAYKVRVQVVPGGGGTPLYCPFTSITTPASLCPAPTDVVANIIVP